MNSDESSHLPAGGGPGSHLAKVFNLDRPYGEDESNFLYVKVKQPKKPATMVKDGSDSPIVVLPLVSASVELQKHIVGGKYTPLGKVICAVYACHTIKDYNIRLYHSQKDPITFAKIDHNFAFTVQGNNYASFYDNDRQAWSLHFSSDKDVVKIAKHIALCKANISTSWKLIKQDLLLGEGSDILQGDAVDIKYTGWLLDNHTVGQVFDSNVSSDKYTKFKIGKGKVIKGWEEGIIGMRKGGKRLLVISPSLAYGAQGREGVIPPNATLIYEIEVKLYKEQENQTSTCTTTAKTETPNSAMERERTGSYTSRKQMGSLSTDLEDSMQSDSRFNDSMSKKEEKLRNAGVLEASSYQGPVTLENHGNQLKGDCGDKFAIGSSTINQIHQNVEEKFSVIKGQIKTYIQDSEKRIENKVDSALQKATEADKSNSQLRVSVKELQASNERLQNQMSTILNGLSHTKQQLLDMQNSNEQLQKTNAYLQNQLSITQRQLLSVHKSNEVLNDQLSLTQQQLLGVQSMMTCSRLWVVSHDQFTLGEQIGRGAWGSVYEATFRGATVAAKRLHDLITYPDAIELFHREMQMALHCQHQNIVTFLGVTLGDHPIILMELMDMNLRDAYTRGKVKGHQVLGILRDVAKALHFLHTRPDPVIHRDVSSANVLLKAQYNVEWLAKLGDLGTAKIQQHITTPGPGALAYAAPEVADPNSHSAKMDVYSYGVLVVEVLTKTLPFKTLDTLQTQIQHKFPQYHQMVISCTSRCPSDRPTMYDVIKQLDKIKTAVA